MSLDKTAKCHICGAPYKFYAFSAADQSACPSCVAYAERQMKEPASAIELAQRAFRRAKHFGNFGR